jgi:microtubule-associated protein, RP/EB family
VSKSTSSTATTKAKAEPIKAAPCSNQENSVPNVTNHTSNTGNGELLAEIENLRTSLQDSQSAYHDLKTEFDGVDKEREFYFEKLRDIEVLLQEVEDKGQGNELTAAIFKILYATADGFEVVSEDATPAASNEVMPVGDDIY